MKNKICLILAVLSIFSVAAGISVYAEKTDISDGLTALYNGLSSDEENGCFSAIALRQSDKTLDLTEFGCLIAKKDVPKNTVTAMKYALTVYACGVKGSVYDALDKDALKAAQSTSALVFSLHLYGIGYDTGMTKDEHIDRLLERATEKGGFPTVGTTPDIDMTAMAVQALSPYKDEPRVADAVEKALSYMSSQQTETGAFKYFNSENCENCAQAVLALSSLGIDARTDERFIKNGVSVYDALLSYRLPDGTFEHVKGGGYNGSATSQAYCALVNNERLAPFYVIDPPETTVEYKAETVKQPVNMTVISVAIICAVGVIVCVVMLILKRKRPVDYIIVAVITAALAVYAGVSGVASGKDVSGCLAELVQCGFLRYYHSLGKAKSGGLYQLMDPYCLFYFEFIESWKGGDARHWSKNCNSPRVNAWRGRAFERVCFWHLPQIKARLGISGVEADAYSWRGGAKGNGDGMAQIDMLIDRADGVVDICEIKYSALPYELGKEEDARIVRRIETFRSASRTRKSVRSVLISAAGLKPGKYSGNIAAVVTGDELFAEVE